MTAQASIRLNESEISASANPLMTIVDCLFTALAALETWRRRHKASMQGARLEARVLRDLGISEAQHFIEVNKPFWEN